MNSLILSSATRVLVALMLLFSIYMLLRGHNEPGGGFIAGLIAAIGFALYAFGHGPEAARRALRIEPQVIAVLGLSLAFVAGLLPALIGEAPFTGQWWFLAATPESKGLPLSSVLLFDIGVYLAVVGAVLTLVLTLEEEV